MEKSEIREVVINTLETSLELQIRGRRKFRRLFFSNNLRQFVYVHRSPLLA